MNRPTKIIFKVVIPVVLYFTGILLWPMGAILFIPAYKLATLKED